MEETSSRRRLDRRAWWVSFVVFAALGGLWALTNPLLAVADEGAHVFKAVTIANGQLGGTDVVTQSDDPNVTSGTVTTYRVDRSVADLLTRQDCWVLDRTRPLGCMPAIGDNAEQVSTGMYAGNYPPLFYAAVGWPARFLDLHLSVFAMRFLAVLISAALLASGLVSILRTRGRAGLIAGTALALTPMTFHLIGSVNPNGVEIASAFCLWAACLELATSRRSPDSRLLVRIVLAAGILASIRPLSPVFVVAIVAAVVLATGTRERAVALWADRRVRIALAAAVAFVLVDVGVILALHSLDSFSGHAIPGLTTGEAAQGSLDRMTDRAREMIGLFGWGSTPVPRWLADGWLWTVAAFGVLALVVGRGRQRLALVAVLVGTIAMPVVSEALKAPHIGYIWQGRYSIAMAMGVPLLAGWTIGTARRTEGTPSRVLAVVAAVGGGVGLVVGQAAWLRRTVVGVNHPFFSWIGGTGWTPPLPTWLLGLATVGLAVVYAGWLIMVAVGSDPVRPRGAPPSADDGALVAAAGSSAATG